MTDILTPFALAFGGVLVAATTLALVCAATYAISCLAGYAVITIADLWARDERRKLR